jgi:GNAT superfamily N-acetyltransferase
MAVTIRRARPGEAVLLPPIERSAGESFRTIAGFESWADADILPAAFHALRIAAGTVWVAVEAGVPLGFATAERIDDELHIWELDVRRDRQGRGLGRRLVEAAADVARRQGLAALTLTTFRDVPWNAPFYARLGFVPLEGDAIGPRLAAILDHEAAQGTDPSTRCAMRRPLQAP